MTFNTPVTAPQYALLREDSHHADYLLTLWPNTTVFSGRVATTDLGTLESWAYLNYSNGVGSYTDIEPGMAILMGTVNDITKARWRGRIRYDAIAGACATANTIYVGESSANFAIGSYFWIIDTFDLKNKLSYIDMNGVEHIDFNGTYAGEICIAPTLRIAYMGWADSVTGKYRLSLDVSDAYSVELNGSVSSVQWIFRSGTATYIVGSSSTPVITIDLIPGKYWARLRMTGSNGVVHDQRFGIAVHDVDNPPSLNFGDLTITAKLDSGWTLTAPAFADLVVNDLYNDTFGVVWRDNEMYGSTAGKLFDDNIAFFGWVQREEDNISSHAAYSVLSDSTFSLTSIGARLMRLESQQLSFAMVGTPIVTGQTPINGLTPWRATVHFLANYTTALDMVGIDFDLDHKNSGYIFPTIEAQGQNALATVQGILKEICADLDFAPDGRLRGDVDAGHLTAGQRAALVTVAAWTSKDCSEIRRSMEVNRNTGIVDGDGWSYNPTNGQVTPFTARAPGLAQEDAQGKATLSAQILSSTADTAAARDELRQRVADELEILNMSEVLYIKHPDGYVNLIPCRCQQYTFTLDETVVDDTGIHRIVYTTDVKWLLEEISYRIYEQTSSGGIKTKVIDVEAVYRRLSEIGDIGIDTTPSPPGLTDTSEIDIPAFDWEIPGLIYGDAGSDIQVPVPNPSRGIIRGNGEELVAATATKCYFLKNVVVWRRPRAVDVTPSDLGSYEVKAVAVSPTWTTSIVPCYLLASDGVNSAVWYTENVAISNPVWTKGADITGVFTIIRVTNIAGSVLIYKSCDQSGTGTVTYVQGSGPATLVYPTTDLYLPELTSILCAQPGYGQYGYYLDVRFAGDKPKINSYFTTGGDHWWNGFYTGGSGPNDSNQSYCSLPLNIPLDSFYAVSCVPFTLTITMFNASGNAVAVLSNDYGATWETPLAVGSGMGNGGFDVQRSGGNSFATAAGVVARATSIGGAYSNYYTITGSAQAACIIVPYYNWAGTKQTDAANPDIIVGLYGVDGSGRSLLWIEGGATPGTVHDISSSSGFTFYNPNSITCRYEKNIAVFGLLSGVQKLHYTINKGTSWVDAKTLVGPSYIRCRRNDDVAAGSPAKGQLYLADDDLWYSSFWASAGMWERYVPSEPIICFDTVY